MTAIEMVVAATAIAAAALWMWGIYDVVRLPTHVWRASGQDKLSALVMQLCIPVIGVLVHLVIVRPVLQGNQLRPRLDRKSRFAYVTADHSAQAVVVADTAAQTEDQSDGVVDLRASTSESSPASTQRADELGASDHDTLTTN